MADDWEQELLAAGWRRYRYHGHDYKTMWVAPHGDIYRGPYHAWRVMRSIKEWGLRRCSDCHAVSSFGGNLEHAKTCTKGDLAVKVIGTGILA